MKKKKKENYQYDQFNEIHLSGNNGMHIEQI